MKKLQTIYLKKIEKIYTTHWQNVMTTNWIEESHGHFSNEDIKLANIYIYENVHNTTNHDMQCMSGKCITEPNELFTPILTAIIKNLGNKYWWWCGEKGFFVHCGWERKLVQLQ